ncbi:hypothetical protein MP228_005568 [Amoeboaphelidium protococcarum]|nr:hypothetical protein MP228_005568 [Amoeboaphelidium protococcarum]
MKLFNYALFVSLASILISAGDFIVTIDSPKKNEVWYVNPQNQEMSITPLQLTLADTESFDGKQMVLGLYANGFFLDSRVADLTITKEQMLESNGLIDTVFPIPDGAHFKDGKKYTVKIYKDKFGFFSSKLGESEKFTIVRLGAQAVEKKLRFVADAQLQVAGSQQGAMDGVIVQVQWNTELLKDQKALKGLKVEVVDAASAQVVSSQDITPSGEINQFPFQPLQENGMYYAQFIVAKSRFLRKAKDVVVFRTPLLQFDYQYGGYADNEYDEENIQGRQYNAIFNDYPQQAQNSDSMDDAQSEDEQENDGGLYESERAENGESYDSDPQEPEEGSDAQYVARLKSQEEQMSRQADSEADYDSPLRSQIQQRGPGFQAQQEYPESTHSDSETLFNKLQRKAYSDHQAVQKSWGRLHSSPLLEELQRKADGDQEEFETKFWRNSRFSPQVDSHQGASGLSYGAYPYESEQSNDNEQQPDMDAYDLSANQIDYPGLGI